VKVIVFGGSGFLGSFVADKLSLEGHQVTIFDQFPSPYLKKNQKMIAGNILQADGVYQAIEGQDVVYNFAGLSDLNASISQPLLTLETNVLGNTYILDASTKCNIQRFVYASTVYVYSNKGSFYGVSKRCSEKIIEQYHEEFSLPYTIIRYGSVYGNRSDEQNRLYRMIREALTHGKITFQGTGEEEREYIHVQDAADLSVEILNEKYKNQNIMLTGIERHSYRDLLKMINEVMGNKIEIKFLNQEYMGHYTITPY